jgi:hypothetical protein
MKGEVYKRKLDMQDLLPFWMLLSAKKKLEDQLRRKTLDLRTRVAK